MSIRKVATLALVLAGLAACTTANYGSSGAVSTGAGDRAATDVDGGLHANSYGYGSRYFQLGRD